MYQPHLCTKSERQVYLILVSFSLNFSDPERSPLELAERTSSDTITGRVVGGVSSAGMTKLNTSESLVRAVCPPPDPDGMDGSSGQSSTEPSS